MLPAPSTARPPPVGIFTAGGLLLGILRVWWRNALAFTAVAVLVELPLLALGLRVGKGMPADPDPGPASPEELRSATLMLLFLWVVNVVAVAALSHGALQSLEGGRAGVGAMLRMVGARLWPVFAVSAVYWSFILVAAFPGIPLIAPGVLVLVIGFVAVPAIIAEPELGTIGALQRSLQLTRGHRIPLFAALLVVFGLYGLALWGAQELTGRFSGLPFAASEGIVSAVDALLTGLTGTAAAVAYHQLRALAPAERTAARP